MHQVCIIKRRYLIPVTGNPEVETNVEVEVIWEEFTLDNGTKIMLVSASTPEPYVQP